MQIGPKLKSMDRIPDQGALKNLMHFSLKKKNCKSDQN